MLKGSVRKKSRHTDYLCGCRTILFEFTNTSDKTSAQSVQLMSTLLDYLTSIMTVQQDDTCPDVCIKWLSQLIPISYNDCRTFSAAIGTLLPLVHGRECLWTDCVRHLSSLSYIPFASKALWEMLDDLVLTSEPREHAPLLQALTAGCCSERAKTELQFLLKHILQTGDLDFVLSIYRFVTKDCNSAGQFILLLKILREVLESSTKVTGIVLKTLLGCSRSRMAATHLNDSVPWPLQTESTNRRDCLITLFFNQFYVAHALCYI